MIMVLMLTMTMMMTTKPPTAVATVVIRPYAVTWTCHTRQLFSVSRRCTFSANFISCTYFISIHTLLTQISIYTVLTHISVRTTSSCINVASLQVKPHSAVRQHIKAIVHCKIRFTYSPIPFALLQTPLQSSSPSATKPRITTTTIATPLSPPHSTPLSYLLLPRPSLPIPNRNQLPFPSSPLNPYIGPYPTPYPLTPTSAIKTLQAPY